MIPSLFQTGLAYRQASLSVKGLSQEYPILAQEYPILADESTGSCCEPPSRSRRLFPD
jgi:hypothetical protein